MWLISGWARWRQVTSAPVTLGRSDRLHVVAGVELNVFDDETKERFFWCYGIGIT